MEEKRLQAVKDYWQREKEAVWRGLIDTEIKNQVRALVPRGSGPVTREQLEKAMGRIAQKAFIAGHSYALQSLLDVNKVAEILGVTPRRVRAKARTLRKQGISVGWKTTGGAWVFHKGEIDLLAKALKRGPKDKHW